MRLFCPGIRSVQKGEVMKALVIYESMYGNTHAVADAIAEGLSAQGMTVTTDAASTIGTELDDGVDLLVVGGPTHARSMTRPSTRQSAIETASSKPDELTVEATASGDGVREWLDSLSHLELAAAAFDTRIDAPALLTGRAAKGIDSRLRALGCKPIVVPESFLVTTQNELVSGELERAHNWGSTLAGLLVPTG